MAAEPLKRAQSAEGQTNLVRLASRSPEPSRKASAAEQSAASGAEQASSHIRARGPSEPSERALERVSEYLRALGLSEPQRVQSLAQSFCDAALVDAVDEAALPEHAVGKAQYAVEQFWAQVLGEDAVHADPLWLRTFVGAMPALFLGDDLEAARREARRFGDFRAGSAPSRAQFVPQAFEPLRVPRWLVGLLPVLLLTSAATLTLVWSLSVAGLSVLEAAWSGLFTVLFGFSAIGLCTALYGFVSGFRRPKVVAADAAEPLPKTVLLMPVYHESAEDVFAALCAMRESLDQTKGGDCFEIFVLSDSRDAEKAAEEERAFRRIATDSSSKIPVYYRRRARNTKQKAGNLAEFFERWGHRYTYAVVLDADSLMRGETLVEMVRRIHAEPSVALLQAPLELHRGETLFARAQQFANSVSGPMFTRGLSVWAGGQGNYYGHNAILRVSALLECCALPELRGEPPLGGHILSHDFVEAALLCRAGWEVRIAHDLRGSWEELPPSLSAYVARDRRWCQGNLQHARIACSEGLQPMSRLHMACGIAAYVASPLWLLFVALGVGLAAFTEGPFVDGRVAGLLTGLTATLLLGPRLMGTFAALCDKPTRKAHGGTWTLLASAFVETLFSALLAPLMMVHHTRIVFSILSGHAVRWNAQKRRASSEIMSTVRAELLTTLMGVGLYAWVSMAAPHLTWYLAPLWLPWSLAIPLALLASSTRMGRLLAKLRLLRVPCETQPDELAQRVDDLRSLTCPDEAARFRDLVLDPVLVSAHIKKLEEAAPRPVPARPEASPEALVRLRQRALRAGPAGLSSEERQLLTRDAESMRQLHREAWRSWPVESYRLSREHPQLPPEPA